MIWRAGTETHRLVIDGASDLNAIALPFDEVFETRLDAAHSFWRAVNGRPVRPTYGSLPAQSRARHILNLRVHDGRQADATYRQIAEALLSQAPIAPGDWRDHPLKHKVRAILKRTDRLIAGGYRDLLFYPHRRGRNSA